MIDMTDECIAGTLVTKGGQLVHPFVRELAGLGPLEQAPEEPLPPETSSAADKSPETEEDDYPADTYKLTDN